MLFSCGNSSAFPSQTLSCYQSPCTSCIILILIKYMFLKGPLLLLTGHAVVTVHKLFNQSKFKTSFNCMLSCKAEAPKGSAGIQENQGDRKRHKQCNLHGAKWNSVKLTRLSGTEGKGDHSLNTRKGNAMTHKSNT